MGVRSLLTLLAVWCGILGMPMVPCAQAQPPTPGSLDTSFGSGGVVREGRIPFNQAFKSGNVNDMAVAADGSIYVMGTCNDVYISDWRVEVMKFTPEGAMATSWGWNGQEQIDQSSTSFGVKMALAGNKVVCVVMSGTRQSLMRLDERGYQDTFGSGGTMQLTYPKGPIGALEVQPDGKILTFGTASANTVTTGVVVVQRFQVSGYEDTTFGDSGVLLITVPGGSAEAKAMRVLADGKILLAGTLLADSARKLFTARLLSTGVLDTAYGSDGFQVAPAFPAAFPTDSIPVVRMEADGQLFAAATSTVDGKVALAHWLGGAGGFNPGFSGDGVAFTAGTFVTPTSLARRADGRLFITAGNRFGAATCTFDGASDNRLGTGGVITSTVTSLTHSAGCVRLQADGKILVAGTAVMPGASNTTMDFVVARYHTDGTPSAPTIITPPVAQTVYGGFPASFSVAVDADNTSPPAFQWKRNGQPIAGATSATYSIAAAQASDEGSITVEVSNLLGTAVSEPVALTVNVQPHIVTAPVAVSGMHNTMVELSVTVTGGIPFTYQWHRGTTDYPAEVSSSFTNKLTVPAEEVNEGSYTVTITNTHSSVTSDPVTLTALPSPPVIATEPTNVQVNSAAGGYVTLTVAVTSTVRPFTYQWKRNGQNFWVVDGTSIPHDTLVLPADLTSNGTFICIITNADGTATSAAATITVVPQPPVITVEPLDVTGVADGGFATLSVTVTGRAPYTYEWRRNGQYFSGGNMTPSTTGNLAFPKLTTSIGLYQCIVRNSDGMATSEEVIVIFQPNGTIRQRTQHLLLNEGDLIMLMADVFSSKPVLKYEWQFNGRKFLGAASQHDNELYLEVTFASAGNYRLLAGTLAGTLVSDNTAMAVVENHDRTVVAAAGKPVILTAKTTGSGLSYLWKRHDGQALDPARMTGINTASLRIAKPDKDKDATDYYCEVHMSGVDMPVTTGRLTLVVESEKPVLDEVAFGEGAVTLPYADYQLSASHSPNRFNVSGLPAGLHCDPLTGLITGTPAAGGTFSVKISATNPVGTSPVTTAKLIIGKLDRTLVGTSTGLVVDGSDYIATLSITVSESGHFTGRGGSTFDTGRLVTSSLAGQLVQDEDGKFTGESNHFTRPAIDAESGPLDCYLTLIWEPSGYLYGILHVTNIFGSFDAYTTTLTRNQWNARTNPARQYAGYYTVAIEHNQADIYTAVGSGYASFTVTTGGTFVYAGRMPDGTAFAIPGFIDQGGNTDFLAWMYGYKGQIAGGFVLGTGSPPLYRDTDVQGILHWKRPPSTLVTVQPVDNEYFNGIDRTLVLQGARYLPPNLALATGPYMMNAGAPPTNIHISVTGVADDGFSSFADASLSTAHKVSAFQHVPTFRTVSFNSLAFNAATGTFSGTASYYLLDSDTHLPLATYPTAFQGIVTRKDASKPEGYGTGYYARLFPYAIYSDDPDIVKPLQIFNVLYSGGVRIDPN